MISESGGNDEVDWDSVEEDEEEVSTRKKSPNYGRIARAIGKYRANGITILPPDINSSSYTYSPDKENNSIFCGFRGITRVSSDMIYNIIQNRPYTTVEDFIEKVKPNKLQMLNLIKSGAFDSISSEPREKILYNYLESISDLKTKLTLQNMSMLIEYDLIPEELSFCTELYLFNKFIRTKKDGTYFNLTTSAIEFIGKNFDADLIVDGVKIPQKVWEKTYSKAMEAIKNYLKNNQDDMLTKLNKKIMEEQMAKYAEGDISHWEMESISFYNHSHELEKVKRPFTNFNELNETPEIIKTGTLKNGQIYNVYQTYQIAGTVIDKDKLHNTITLLTKSGVVQVKIYKNQFADYDKQISQRNSDGKKVVIERSWFKKGTLLIAQGYRRDDTFVLKKNKTSVAPLLAKIVKIKDDGNFEMVVERAE